MKQIVRPLVDAFNPPNPKFIISAFGLGLIKPKFYKTTVNSDEEDARALGLRDVSLNNFGLPVFDVLDIERVSYKQTVKRNGVYEEQTYTTPAMRIATVLFEVSQSKNIISTPISGRNGTVKEYISDGDYIVNIKGVLVGNGAEVKPEQLVRQLIDFCQAPVPLNVTSPYLESFEIYTIVVKDYNFRQLEGNRNVVPFELICLSETPFEIQSTRA